jgi:hypothetical protein
MLNTIAALSTTTAASFLEREPDTKKHYLSRSTSGDLQQHKKVKGPQVHTPE